MVGRKEVEEKLKALAIHYDIVDHPAAYTVEDMERLGIFGSGDGLGCKNLFLRDGSGKNHFLVVVREDKQVDLKALRHQLGCSRLSFGSPERLMKYLGLTPGAVSPLGVLNDQDRAVVVAFDRDLVGQPRLGFHPNDNTATAWISYGDLMKVLEDHGNQVRLLDLP